MLGVTGLGIDVATESHCQLSQTLPAHGAAPDLDGGA